MRVLVTDGDYKHTLGIVRSLGRNGHQVGVLARHAKELAAQSRFCSTVECVPHLTIENYKEAVLGILRRARYDLLMPVGYASTLALAKGKKEITALTRMEIAEPGQIEFSANKKCVSELAQRLGLHVPQAVYPETLEKALHLEDELEYPVVLKPVMESLPKSLRLVRSREEFAPMLESLCEMQPLEANYLPMIQSFVPGYGCGFFALYQEGVCKRVFMHRRIRENPPGGGGSCCAESFYDPVLKEAGTRLLNALTWHGVAMVEFRYDVRQRKYMVLEVNPKFWGSLDLALAAGADFPQYLCQMARGESVAYSEDYRCPLRYHWPFSGEIQHLWERPSSFGAIAADLLNPRVKSNFWFTDILPNALEFFSLFGTFQRRVLKG